MQQQRPAAVAAVAAAVDAGECFCLAHQQNMSCNHQLDLSGVKRGWQAAFGACFGAGSCTRLPDKSASSASLHVSYEHYGEPATYRRDKGRQNHRLSMANTVRLLGAMRLKDDKTCGER